MFTEIVNLYRLSKKPKINASEFSYNGTKTPDLEECLSKLKDLPARLGHFEEEPKIDNKNISFSFKIAANGNAGFFESFSELIINSRALGKGIRPENFYIVDEDWSTTDSTTHPCAKKISETLETIKHLSTLATTTDANSSNTHLNLFFSAPGEKDNTVKTFSVSTQLTPEILKINIKHQRLLKSLTSQDFEHKLNMEERKLIFCAAIIESVPHDKKRQINIMDTLKHWDDILEKYWLNLQTFVYGFSFAKVREDLAKTELEYGSKLSATFSDIAGKLLALPVSLIGLVALEKAQTDVEIASSIIALAIVSTVALATLRNQKLNISRIENGVSLIFDQFDKRKLAYRREIRSLFEKSRNEISKQQKFLNNTLILFQTISLIPIAGAITICYSRWNLAINEAMLSYWVYIFSYTHCP